MDKTFERIYVEITNVCNLNCSFCPKTKREKRSLNPEEFDLITDKLYGSTKYLYFHVMGEPLLNPNISEFLTIAERKGFNVNITTNGTLLSEYGIRLQNAKNLKKVFISLHSFEGNNGEDLENYLDGVWAFCSRRKFIVSLRLWNRGGLSNRNDEIIDYLMSKTGKDIYRLFAEKDSITLGEGLYLERADKFIWPSQNVEKQTVSSCHGLINQLGVLVDGTVVPCCLDNDGSISLGNLFKNSLSEILSGERATAFLDGYKKHRMTEELCNHCEYATRFKK